MPIKPKQYCRYPGCSQLVDQKAGYCDKHKKPTSEYENSRDSANKRGYSARWQKARLRYLREHPLCVECLSVGVVEPAEVVDHIEPHRGNYDLFWNEDNWQSLCLMHHNKKTGEGK